MLAVMENVHDSGDKYGLGEYWRKCHRGAREPLCHYEGKQHRPWFDEKCFKRIDKWKQGKLQWYSIQAKFR